MADTPYHRTLKELTTAQKQTNENLLKINESIKTQMSGVAKAVSEPPPTNVEEKKEKKAENKKFLESLKGILKAGAGGVGKGGINVMDWFKKFIGGKLKLILMGIGAGLLALFSQLNMKQLKEMWTKFKDALVSLYDLLAPIATWLKEWAVKTVIPATFKLFIEQLDNITEMFTDIKDQLKGWEDKTAWENFMSVLGVFEIIGTFAVNSALALIDWGAALLGYEGSLTKDVKEKFGVWFGGVEVKGSMLFGMMKMMEGVLKFILPEEMAEAWSKNIKGWLGNDKSDEKEDSIMGKISSGFKTLLGLFTFSLLFGKTWFGKVLRLPIRLALKGALMGTKGSIGLISKIASAMGSSLPAVGAIAKGLGIAGLVYAVGSGLVAGYQEWEKGGTVKDVWTAGLSEFMQALTLGMVSKETGDKWARGITNFFGDVYDMMFGEKVKIDTKEEIRRERELRSGTKFKNMTPEQKRAAEKELRAKMDEEKRGGPGSTLALRKEDMEGLVKQQQYVLNAIAGEQQIQMASKKQDWTKWYKLTAQYKQLDKDIAGLYNKQSGIGNLKGIIKPLDLSQLQEDEGFRKGVYKDSVRNKKNPHGIDTIGYGFNLERAGAQEALDAAGIKKSVANLRSGKLQLTKEEADRLMRGEYPHFADAAKRFVNKGKEGTWSGLTLDRQKILTNMAYNMGATGLNKFDELRKALQNRDYEKAGEEMMSSDWAKSAAEGGVGARANRLTARMTNTSGNQLAAGMTEQGNLQARLKGGGITINNVKGGDSSQSVHHSVGTSSHDPMQLQLDLLQKKVGIG